MIGYTYFNYYIMTIETDEYDFVDKTIVDSYNASYVTTKFMIINIEDINSNKIDLIDDYIKNNIYQTKIYFYLNKQIAIDKKIANYKLYKDISSRKIQPGRPNYKNILDKYFSDIQTNGISGIYKSYYANGTLQEEYFHNNCDIEGEYKEYYNNGNIRVTCNYLKGKKHGKWTQYHENDNGKVQYWDDYLNANKQLDWRYMTTVSVPKDYPQDKIWMLCD